MHAVCPDEQLSVHIVEHIAAPPSAVAQLSLLGHVVGVAE